WEVAVFVLNVLAFVLVGLQLRLIVTRLERAARIEYAWVAAAVCAAAILARIAWVMLAATRKSAGFSPRAAMLIGWCGMRGTVTLAAALALPVAFPHRDLILVTAFGVVLGTLVLQGMTLRPLLTRLRLEDDGAVEREVRLVRAATAAERQRLTAMRADGTIGDAAFQKIEQELDLEELDLDVVLRAEVR